MLVEENNLINSMWTSFINIVLVFHKILLCSSHLLSSCQTVKTVYVIISIIQLNALILRLYKLHYRDRIFINLYEEWPWRIGWCSALHSMSCEFDPQQFNFFFFLFFISKYLFKTLVVHHLIKFQKYDILFENLKHSYAEISNIFDFKIQQFFYHKNYQKTWHFSFPFFNFN